MDKSKYDRDAEEILLAYNAEAVLLLVLGGQYGLGCCLKQQVKGVSRAALADRTERLAHALRLLAKQMEADAHRIRDGHVGPV